MGTPEEERSVEDVTELCSARGKRKGKLYAYCYGSDGH